MTILFIKKMLNAPDQWVFTEVIAQLRYHIETDDVAPSQIATLLNNFDKRQRDQIRNMAERALADAPHGYHAGATCFSYDDIMASPQITREFMEQLIELA